MPAEAVERVAFAYSPVLEASLSLHVVAGPKHHPVQHAWVRRVRRLAPALRRELDAMQFAWATDVPSFLLPSSAGGFDSFPDELQRLRALDPTLVAFEFLRPHWDHGGDRDAAVLARDDVRARVAERAGPVALALFDDPASLLERFLGVLAEYWDAAFAAEWERIEPLLSDSVIEAGRRIAGDGLYPFLRSASRRLRVDEEHEEFGIDIPHHHRVEVTDERTLTLVPSAYVWPHVRVNCDEPFPLSVVYPAAFVTREARPQLPDAELLRLLKVLGDDTRLRALRLIAEAPRSTQELAPLVGITEAGLSKHLRLLADAGVVEARRDGYYVLYSLAPERIRPLSAALLEYLGRAGGDDYASQP